MAVEVAAPEAGTSERAAAPRQRILRAPAIAAVLGAGAWLLAETASYDPLSPLLPPALKATAVLLIGLVLLGRLWFGSRAEALLADVAAALVGVFCSFSLATALHATPWSLYGLNGDQMFRTGQVTAYANQWGLDDLAYKDLPGFYPPLFPWLLGRIADLAGVAPWRTVRPFEIVMALAIPVAGYLFWRRLVPPWAAVGVTAVVSLLAANPAKADEWLVLTVIVPWWFDAFRDVRRDGLNRWPAWVHGIVAGLLLLAATFYFVPLAIATLAGLAVDWRRHRAIKPQLVRGAWIVGVGLLVSAVFWLPTVVWHLTGHPFTNTQFRWNDPNTTRLPSPLALSVLGVIMMAGIVYLALRAYHDRLAETFAVLVASVYLFYVLGYWLAMFDRPILVFHAEPLLHYTLLAAGAVGACAAAAWLAPKEKALVTVVILVGAVVVYSASENWIARWASGRPVETAQSTRLPDGSQPRYADEAVNKGIGYNAPPTEPPAKRLYDTVTAGRPSSWRPVMLCARSDVMALYPNYTFLGGASIYSNGFAQYRDRADFLRELAGEQDPAAFARLARDNPYDPIDAFVLRVSGDRLSWSYRIDDFPRMWTEETVSFSRDQFSPEYFTITQVGRYFVAVYAG